MGLTCTLGPFREIVPNDGLMDSAKIVSDAAKNAIVSFRGQAIKRRSAQRIGWFFMSIYASNSIGALVMTDWRFFTI